MGNGICRVVMVLGFLLVIKSTTVYSQFSDTVNYHLAFAGTGNLNKTNTGTTYLFNNALKFDINKQKFSLNSMASYIYGQNPTQKTNNDFLSVVNFDVLRAVQKFYYWGLASYEESFSLKIKNRFQIGGGVGYTIIDKPTSNIVVSDGLLFETTDLSEPDKRDRLGYQTLRNSFRVKFRFIIKDIVTIDGSDFFQHSISDTRDYILKVNTNFSVKIYRALSLTAAFNYNRLNISETENLLLSYGLSFEKYF